MSTQEHFHSRSSKHTNILIFDTVGNAITFIAHALKKTKHTLYFLNVHHIMCNFEYIPPYNIKAHSKSIYSTGTI